MKLQCYGEPGAAGSMAPEPRCIGSGTRPVRGAARRTGRIAALDPQELPLVEGTPRDDVRLGPCVGAIGKLVCIGLNCADHAEGAGTPGAYIDEADAMAHIAGYCVINDVSERDFQLNSAGTWDKGKGCDTFGQTGPCLVTPDEIDDVDALDMLLDVDGKRMQSGSTATLIFRMPHPISCCSRFMSLRPGDVVSTGKPPGVGMGQQPPRYLQGREVVELGKTGLGRQRAAVLPAVASA